MDNLTHTLFAATLARTPLGRAGRGATVALLLASNAPDVDIVTTAGGVASYLHWHRGPTHGPLGIIGLGLVTAGLVWIGRRAFDKKATDAPASFAMLAVVSMTGVLLHVLMDLPTSYGTRSLSPFDWHWFSVDWIPIVDIYLLIALAAGLFFGRGSRAAGRRNAAIVIALMVANYAVRGAAHHRALDVAVRLFGPSLPAACSPTVDASLVLDRWPRSTDPRSQNSVEGRCLVEMAALPSFVSPLRWRVVAQVSDAYEVRDIDLLNARDRNLAGGSETLSQVALRYPNQWTPRVVAAAGSPLGRTFLGFSRFPAARSFVDNDGVATVRWSDMRFVGGAIRLDQPAPPGPFTAIIRVGPDGRILGEHLGP